MAMNYGYYTDGTGNPKALHKAKLSRRGLMFLLWKQLYAPLYLNIMYRARVIYALAS